MQGNIVNRTHMAHLIDSSQYAEEIGNASQLEDTWTLRDFEPPQARRNEHRPPLNITT